VSSGRLGNFSVWHRLDGMNEIREQDGVLDEEDRNVVPNNIYLFSAIIC
jgi:hypothetical protein